MKQELMWGGSDLLRKKNVFCDFSAEKKQKKKTKQMKEEKTIKTSNLVYSCILSQYFYKHSEVLRL